MRALMQLSFEALDRIALDKRLSEIGRDELHPHS